MLSSMVQYSDTITGLLYIAVRASISGLLPISMLFISIVTLTNTGGCYGIQIGIPNTGLHK